MSPLDIDITGFIHMSFIISCSYGGRKFQSLEDLRYHQFMKMAATLKTTIKPHSLAPTESATTYQSIRVHLQVIEWKTLMRVELNLLDWGWKLSNGHHCPIMTDWNGHICLTIFFVLFDVIGTSPRNAHAVLVLAVAKSMVLSVFLLVEVVMG